MFERVARRRFGLDQDDVGPDFLDAFGELQRAANASDDGSTAAT